MNKNITIESVGIVIIIGLFAALCITVGGRAIFIAQLPAAPEQARMSADVFVVALSDVTNPALEQQQLGSIQERVFGLECAKENGLMTAKISAGRAGEFKQDSNVPGVATIFCVVKATTTRQ